MKYFLWAILFTGSSLAARAQSGTNIFPDLLLDADRIYTIDKMGQFKAWNVQTLQPFAIRTDSTIRYTAITKDRQNNIWLGSDKGVVFRFDKANDALQKTLASPDSSTIYHLFFNQANDLFLILNNGVYAPAANTLWADFDCSGNIYDFLSDSCFEVPEYIFTDSNDAVWMTKCFGEFGGVVQFFDAKHKRSVKHNGLSIYSPRSVFEDDQKQIFITSGLQHFGSSGAIYQIKDTVAQSILFDEDIHDASGNKFEGGVFIGPGAYNPIDKKLYFASNQGYFSMKVTAKGEHSDLTPVFTPTLTWSREGRAIGAAMAIRKIAFTTDNKLVFLTDNDGVGIWDGKKVEWLR